MTEKQNYPDVKGEIETLDLVLSGKSIGRYGDGEFNHVRGKKNVSQMVDRGLTRELKALLLDPPKACIVGIPTMNPAGKATWLAYKDQYAKHLNPKVKYVSAFITRPDSAPWIDTPEFYDKVESLWRGQKVTLVANGVRSLKPDFLRSHDADVNYVECPYRDAYRKIDELEDACLRAGRRVILCAGPTATVLAARLARAGLHAVDAGHIGMFWRRYADPKRIARPEQRELNIQTGKVEPNEGSIWTSMDCGIRSLRRSPRN